MSNLFNTASIVWRILMKKQLLTLLCSIVIALAGCAPSRLDFKEEPLTGEKYCVASNKLIASKNSETAEFSLKYLKEDFLRKAPIKATLAISQKGREYNINPNEILKLIVDKETYNLDITNSFQVPLEIAESRPISIPGGTFMLGSIKECTKRQMSFFLTLEYLSKITEAKQVFFEISIPSTESSTALQKYPILLELNPESIEFLKEFQHKCVNNFPN